MGSVHFGVWVGIIWNCRGRGAGWPSGRRGFLDRSIKGGLGAALGVATLRAPLKAVAPSDKVVVGIMGVGKRGTSLTQLFAQRPDVEIAYVCDVDDRKAALAAKAVQNKKGKAPTAVGSFEHILEDSDGRCLSLRHSGPLAFPGNSIGLPSGQRRLCGKPGLAQYLGRPEDGRGRA